MMWEKKRFLTEDLRVRLWRYRFSDVVLDAHGPQFDFDAAAELRGPVLVIRRKQMFFSRGGEHEAAVLDQLTSLLASHGLTLTFSD